MSLKNTLRWRWIVMDGDKPVRWHRGSEYYAGGYAEVFALPAIAQRVKASIQRRYFQLAENAGKDFVKEFPDAKGYVAPLFKKWYEKAEQVRVIRVGRFDQ